MLVSIFTGVQTALTPSPGRACETPVAASLSIFVLEEPTVSDRFDDDMVSVAEMMAEGAHSDADAVVTYLTDRLCEAERHRDATRLTAEQFRRDRKNASLRARGIDPAAFA